MKKIIITSRNAHFKIPYASKIQTTYPIPPISTVLGMLRVIFGEDIDNFTFGYIFQSEGIYNDLMNSHKINADKDFSFINTIDKTKNKIIPAKPKTTDWMKREYLFNCKLIIYTDIDREVQMSHPLTMGRANCLARLHFPIKDIKLIDKEGIGYNQFTPIEVCTGQIMPVTYYSKYDKKLQSFQTKVKHLRLNKEFIYDKNFDQDEEQNVFLWQYKGGEIIGIC